MIPQTDFYDGFHVRCVSAIITEATNITELARDLEGPEEFTWLLHGTLETFRYIWQKVASYRHWNLDISLNGEFWKVIKSEVYINIHPSHCPYEIINSIDNLTAVNQ